jgi:ethanolamine transporter
MIYFNISITYIISIFIILACVDRVAGRRYGLGKAMEEGFYTLGPLAVVMLGMVSMAPVIAKYLSPTISPILIKFGADPSLFISIFVASDCGGALLAKNMCITNEAGLFNGLIIGSTLGATLGVIPVILSSTKIEIRKHVIVGLLCGISTIPIGALAAGLTAGFNIHMLLSNLAPITLVSIIIIFSLLLFQKSAIFVMNLIGWLLIFVSTLGLALSSLQYLTGIVIIPGMAPLEDGFIILGQIAIVLAGTFPFLYIIKIIFKNPLSKLSNKLDINEISLVGLITTLANFFPTINMLNKMDPKGIIFNTAFAVSAGYVFGDFLGFTFAFEKSMALPLIIGKLTGGIFALLLSVFLSNRINFSS